MSEAGKRLERERSDLGTFETFGTKGRAMGKVIVLAVGPTTKPDLLREMERMYSIVRMARHAALAAGCTRHQLQFLKPEKIKNVMGLAGKMATTASICWLLDQPDVYISDTEVWIPRSPLN